MAASTENTLARSLTEKVGVKGGHAYDLANGRRTPSLALALRIEKALGIPPSAWPMPSKEPVNDPSEGAEAA